MNSRFCPSSIFERVIRPHRGTMLLAEMVMTATKSRWSIGSLVESITEEHLTARDKRTLRTRKARLCYHSRFWSSSLRHNAGHYANCARDCLTVTRFRSLEKISLTWRGHLRAVSRASHVRSDAESNAVRRVRMCSKRWTCALIFDTCSDSFPARGKSRALGAKERAAARKNDILRAPRRGVVR